MNGMGIYGLFAATVPDSNLWAIVAILIVVAVISPIIWFFSGHCRKCQRYRSLKRTGETRKEGGRFFGTTYVEYRCTNCGFIEWVKSNYSGGGGF